MPPCARHWLAEMQLPIQVLELPPDEAREMEELCAVTEDEDVQVQSRQIGGLCAGLQHPWMQL